MNVQLNINPLYNPTVNTAWNCKQVIIPKLYKVAFRMIILNFIYASL
jgi:hypothetical protein